MHIQKSYMATEIKKIDIKFTFIILVLYHPVSVSASDVRRQRCGTFMLVAMV